MMLLDWSTFVLERRINRPFGPVIRTITNPAVFGPGCVVSSDPDGALRLDEAFHRIDMFRHTVWRAHATLLDTRGRRIAAVEIEIGPWSSTSDTHLVLRPRARRPEEWSRPRLRRYFAHAHVRADGLTHLLLHSAPERTRGQDVALGVRA